MELEIPGIDIQQIQKEHNTKVDLKKHGNVDRIHLAQYRGHWDISCEHHNESQDSEKN